LLKILCGLMRSKSLSFAEEIDASIPPEWLRVLFGQRDFLDGCGLYVRAAAGHRFEGPYGLKFQPITNRSRITGLGIWIYGYEFVLSMSGFPDRQFDGSRVAYRPLELYAAGPAFEKSVIFCWSSQADLGTITLHIGGL
jgi:hypothetical protein